MVNIGSLLAPYYSKQICCVLIHPHRPYSSNYLLVQRHGGRQGAGALFQVDQRGSTYPQGRPTRYESGRGQLSTQYAYDRFLDTASSHCVKNWKN